MVKVIPVHSHYRKSPTGRKHKVKPYKRRNRGLGKKIKYTMVGNFYVAHDNLGNFRGSKIKSTSAGKKLRKRSDFKLSDIT